MKVNKLYNVDVRVGLSQMIKENLQTDCIITSPPYWSLRDYGIPPSIWDGDPECEHEFEVNEEVVRFNNSTWKEGKNGEVITKEKRLHEFKIRGDFFCLKCGAWKGTLGLEPNFELYIKHLCDIYDLAGLVLKKTGTNWVNLGDTHSGGGGISGVPEDWESMSMSNRDKFPKTKPSRNIKNIPAKSLGVIPFRFTIEMINRGWILRNVIIWHKTNPMPSSARDRFTIDFEYVFFFVKSNKTQYWINEKTAQSVSKQPIGTKGIENIDWEWRKCKKCLGTGIKHKKCKYCDESSGWYYDELLRPQICPKCNGKGRIKQNEECKSCKGKGVKKYNFWRGRQYWFEQIRESLSDNPSTQERYKYKVGNQNNRKDTGVKMVKSGKGFSKHFSQDLPQKEDFPILKYTQNDLKEITKEKSGWQKERDKGINNRAKYQSREWTEWMEGVPLTSNPLGKNKRTVWTIPTYSNPENHFATFPPKLIEPMILSGCPEFICKECGIPREKILQKIPMNIKKHNLNKGKSRESVDLNDEYYKPSPFARTGVQFNWKIEQKGYSDCGCNAGFTSGIIADIFAGTGTTLYQAWKLGRNYIGFEISEEYCQIAERYLKKCNNMRLDKFIYDKEVMIDEL